MQYNLVKRSVAIMYQQGYNLPSLPLHYATGPYLAWFKSYETSGIGLLTAPPPISEANPVGPLL